MKYPMNQNRRAVHIGAMAGIIVFSITLVIAYSALTSGEEDGSYKSGLNDRNLLGDSSFESNPNYCRLRDGTKWWEVGGDLVKGDSYHGQYAIKSNAASSPYALAAEQQYTLSFYCKGEPGKDIRTRIKSLSVKDPIKEAHFSASSGWKRYSMSFVPHVEALAGASTYSVEISAPECLIDAVQLEKGALTEYAPQDMELFLLVGRLEDRSFVTYFYDGESVPVLATVQKKGPAEVKCDAVVRDFWMNEVLRIPIEFKIPEGKIVSRATVSIPKLPRGAYRVALECGEEKSRSIQMGVISRDFQKGSDICGGSHETGREFNRDFVEALGITWSRHHAGYTGPYWGRDNSVPWLGSDYWKSEDQYITEKSKNPKLRHWGSFLYPPEPYATRLKEVYKTDRPLPDGFMENARECFQAAVPHFKETVRYWECWNEAFLDFTPEQYLQMLKAFYREIKSLDPDAIVVGFSGSFIPRYWEKFMVPLLEMGSLKYCDAVSYHGYWWYWPEDKIYGHRELRQYLEHIRREAAKIGKPDMPIWDNEFTLWGTSWYDDERMLARPRSEELNRFDYKTGAAAVVHYMTIAYAHGVRHFGPHCFDHDLIRKDEGPVEYDQRGFEYDRAIKPKAISYAVVCNKLQDAKFVSEIIRGDLFIFTFEKQGGSLAVVFMRHGKKATLKLLAGDLVFKNIFDGPSSGVRRDGDSVFLDIDMVGEPVYVESSGSAKDLLETIGSVFGIVLQGSSR